MRKNHPTTDIIAQLAEVYPQLSLNPDRDDRQAYQAIVRRGEQPAVRDLSQYHGDPGDRLERVATPVGDVETVLLHNREDFERVVRNMMAAKEGLEAQVPATQGAATFIAFNWPRIHAHKEAFFRAEEARGVLFPDWNAEFKRFTAVKSNYQDMVIVLSAGPYSALSAKEADLPEDEWLEKSYIIRKYHECTHVICRKRYPELIDPVWDELVADAIGLYAAFDAFDPALALKLLGFQNGAYTGGRLENYTDHCDFEEVNGILKMFLAQFEEHPDASPFEMIDVLEGLKKDGDQGQTKAI